MSPPLVAFRESVFCAEEAEEGQAAKPVRVVEASTPSGACTVRVRAHALPGGLASALDDNAALLKQLLERQAAAERGEGAAADSAAANGEAGAESITAAAAAAEKRGDVDADFPGLAALRQRVVVACSDAANGKQLLRLLRRAWLLGPRRIGPNMLLSPDEGTGGHGGSLFDAPPAGVVRTTRHAGKSSAAAAAAAHAGGGEEQGATGGGIGGGGDPAAVVVQEATMPVPLGDRGAAELLGLTDDGVTSHLAAQLQQQQLDDGADADADADSRRSAGGSRPSSRAGRPWAQAAGPVCSAPGWRHVRSSIASGVVSGFMLASASGPLMDEPLWGVAFEIEARVRPPALGALDASEAAGGGEAAAAGAAGGSAFDIQEDVYGPFSGQVMTAVAAACRQAVMEADARLVEALFLCQVRRGDGGWVVRGWPASFFVCAQITLLVHPHHKTKRPPPKTPTNRPPVPPKTPKPNRSRPPPRRCRASMQSWAAAAPAF